jgi:hypothetical protein
MDLPLIREIHRGERREKMYERPGPTDISKSRDCHPAFRWTIAPRNDTLRPAIGLGSLIKRRSVEENTSTDKETIVSLMRYGSGFGCHALCEK